MKQLFASRKSQCLTAWFLLAVYFNMVACSYYRVKTVDPLSNQSIEQQIQKKRKYIILHAGEAAWHLKDIVVDGDNKKINGTIEALPDNHLYYKTAKPRPKSNRYQAHSYYKEGDDPIHEIHIYTTSMVNDINSSIDVPFSTINKLEIYDKHVGATVAAVVGSVLAAFVVVIIIIAATKSSCPFVYIKNGETYSFTGEMYGGAIYPSLERDDYMPLPGIQSVENSYQLKIANELLEKQYTNLAKLLVVSHPQNSEVIIDKNGSVQTLMDLKSPLISTGGSGTDFIQQVLKRDSVFYSFQESNRDDTALSSLVMSFKWPANCKTGKLVVNAKNSYWLDYVYGKFNELFGVYYNSFAEQQKKESSKKLNQWSRDQHIPLSVYVETKSGWKFVDYFNTIGPLASRDIVMPIDLSDVKGEEIKIKLESGFRFWEVDYAAMDFSSNIPVEITSSAPVSAVDENGKDVSDLLSATDDKYLVQPEIGNVVTATYKSPSVQADKKRTVFLHSRGYYEYIRDYENLPDIGYLKSFSEKGAFTKFAREQFNVFAENQEFFAAALTQRDED